MIKIPVKFSFNINSQGKIQENYILISRFYNFYNISFNSLLEPNPQMSYSNHILSVVCLSLRVLTSPEPP